MIKLAWRHYSFPSASGPISGIARGYLSSAFYLYSALREVLGAGLVDAPAEGAHPRIHLHYAPPHFFKPIPGKTNVLFTMWEGAALPAEVLAALRRAEGCVVPSTFCQAIWNHHGIPAAVVPLGVPDAYLACDPSRGILAVPSGPRRRFLWVGSPIARKGWDRLIPAWRRAFSAPGHRAQLYIKTIDGGGLREFPPGEVVVDGRDLEPEEMLALYRSADVFLSTSYGEGFGLPHVEAMAAGCLVVSPLSGGPADFLADDRALIVEESGAASIEYGGERFQMRVPTVEDIAAQLRVAYDAWGLPPVELRRQRGVAAARAFSWRASARRLVEILAGAAEVSRGTFSASATRPAAGAAGEAAPSDPPADGERVLGDPGAPGAP